MKNLILCFIFIVAGALLFSVTEGYSSSSFLNCGTVKDCTQCHSWSFCDVCPSDPTCDTPPISTCNDGDGDGYGTPSDGCANRAPDCDDYDANVYPGADELCNDNVDNDCDDKVDCDDSDCFRDSVCLPATCDGYLNNRRACNQDSRCEWDRTLGCQDYVDLSIYTDEGSCLREGGRWNKRKAICR